MVIVLLQTSMGSGILTLPYITKENGIVVFPLILMLTSILFYYYLWVLMWCAFKTKTNDYSALLQ